MFPLPDHGLPHKIWLAGQKFVNMFKMISKNPLKALLKNSRTTEAFGHTGLYSTSHVFRKQIQP